MKIKEKVLIEKTLGEYSKERGEPFLFNYATIQEFGLLLLEKNFAEVNKVIDDWQKKHYLSWSNPQSCTAKDYAKNWKELKQKLGGTN